jgi:hypothetical protein
MLTPAISKRYNPPGLLSSSALRNQIQRLEKGRNDELLRTFGVWHFRFVIATIFLSLNIKL